MAAIIKKPLKSGIRWKAIIRTPEIPYLSKSFKTKAAAQKWANRMEIDADLAKAESNPIMRQMTLANLCDEYLLYSWQGKDPARPGLVAWWRRELGSTRIRDLTKQKVRDALRGYKAGKARRGDGVDPETMKTRTKETSRPRSGATVNRMRAALAAILKYGNPPVLPGELFVVWSKLLEQEEVTAASYTPPENVDMEEVRSALNHLDPDMDRDGWYRVGMALHSLSPDLYGEWDLWSAGGDKYAGGHDTHTVWKSFGDTANPVTIRSLFKMAQQAGWVRQFRAPEVNFQPVQGHDSNQNSDAIVSPTTNPQQIGTQSVVGEGDDTREAALLRRAQQVTPDMVDPVNRQAINQILLETDAFEPGVRTAIYSALRGQLHWSQRAIQDQVTHVRRNMAVTGAQPVIPDNLQKVVDEYAYISETNQFFRPSIKQFLAVEAFRNRYCHMVPADASVTQEVLAQNLVKKVDRVDYAPGHGKFFEENGAEICNLWNGIINRGRPGDPTPWLNHFDVLGWGGETKKHLLQWMAFTLRHPERKINHIPMLGGPEGNGKDFLLYPMKTAMGENAGEISGEMLLDSFQDYLLGIKYLHINETEHGHHSDARKVVSRLKPLGANPPTHLKINPTIVPLSRDTFLNFPIQK